MPLLSAFNIQSTAVLQKVAVGGLIGPRIQTIARVDPALAANFANWLDQHMSEKLGLPVSQLSKLRRDAVDRLRRSFTAPLEEDPRSKSATTDRH